MRGFELRLPKGSRSAEPRRGRDQSTGDGRNQGLPVEKPFPQGIKVDHRRNRDDRAAAAAPKCQDDAWVERMFGDAMGQRVARHGGGHRKETERPRRSNGFRAKPRMAITRATDAAAPARAARKDRPKPASPP